MTTQFLRIFINKNHLRFLSKTYRNKMETRAVIKNNFLVTGNLKNAKQFAHDFAQYKPHSQKSIFTSPITIFASGTTV